MGADVPFRVPNHSGQKQARYTNAANRYMDVAESNEHGAAELSTMDDGIRLS